MSFNAYDKDTDTIIDLSSDTMVDAVPTEGSTRPVSSGGVYDEFETLEGVHVSLPRNYYDIDNKHGFTVNKATEIFNDLYNIIGYKQLFGTIQIRNGTFYIGTYTMSYGGDNVKYASILLHTYGTSEIFKLNIIRNDVTVNHLQNNNIKSKVFKYYYEQPTVAGTEYTISNAKTTVFRLTSDDTVAGISLMGAGGNSRNCKNCNLAYFYPQDVAVFRPDENNSTYILFDGVVFYY